MDIKYALDLTREAVFTAMQYSKKTNDQDILLFPRKKLEMTKVYSTRQTPRSWFIKERLDETATCLTQSTEESKKGLTSGFRGAIIKNPDQTYTKLKGVSLKPTISINKTSELTQGKITIYAKGLCSLEEALYEAHNFQFQSCVSPRIVPATPQFIESYRFYQKTPTLNEFIQDYNQKQFFLTFEELEEDQWEKLHLETKRLYKNLINQKFNGELENTYFVFATRIEGDTRLDEVMYHLTKKPLKGGLKEKRDEILEYLCFRAGIMKGLLTTTGYSWSADLVQSNSHFGNFVILPTARGIVEARITDLGGCKPESRFGSYSELVKFSNQEIEDFKEEFDKTSGLTVQRPYKFFPKLLKKKCLDSLKTGYAIILANKGKGDYFSPTYTPSKINVPSKIMITLDEFKETIKEIEKI